MEKNTIDYNKTIPKDSKIKVYWDDRPENYSREGKNRVKTHFSNKYGVDKKNINVIFRPKKINNKGEVIELDGLGIDNIMDVNYQRGLMKEWIEREGKEVDFKRIIKLDEKVNSGLNIDINNYNHKRWCIKWLTINNFLCFGDGNEVNFTKLNGLTIINSNPENQGGKSTFAVDSIKFLLFGKTTKTNKNEEIFNTYSDKNMVVVKGLLVIDNENIIIERKLTRKPKRNGGWNITHKLSYYKIMPDGEEVILEEEDANATTLKIKNTIGSESDFDITIIATAKNLEDLIDASPTDSGKLITKFIGLEVIEMKERVVRDMYNEYSKKMKSNHYNIAELEEEITNHKKEIDKYTSLLDETNIKLLDVKSEIESLNNKRDSLLSSKKNIDINISTINPENIEKEISKIIKKGKEFKNEIDKYNIEISNIGEVFYDEVKYFDLTKKYNELELKLENNRRDKKRHEEIIYKLKNDEICPMCKRPLDDVDHTNEIKNEEKNIEKLDNEYDIGSRKLEKLSNDIDSMLVMKKKVDLKNQIELKKDRAEVEIDELRVELKNKKSELDKYKENEESIKFNRNIDSEVEIIKTKIKVAEVKKDTYIRDIQIFENNITNNKNEIVKKEKLIDTIKKENDVVKIFKIYIDMIGKKGISKLILRSVLPIINSELYRLMEDVVDFDIELVINDKNEIGFVLIKDDVEKPLKSGSGLEKTASSLALRCVLGKLSNLPIPNFVIFDEIFGKLADVNIIKIKPMFDKIKEMFEIVFIITMRNFVKEWGDNVVTINKTNNISEITVR